MTDTEFDRVMVIGFVLAGNIPTHEQLKRLTAKQVRQLANDCHVTLSYSATTKAGAIQDLIGSLEYRNRTNGLPPRRWREREPEEVVD